MMTFGLVHGAWHGAWCWRDVIAELEQRGHDAVAPDLPIDDASAGLDDYAREVVRALSGHDDVVRRLGVRGLRVATGEFQASMRVTLVNDGPVTLLLDSRRRF